MEKNTETSTLLLEDFRVSPLAPLQGEGKQLKTGGLKCLELCVKADLGLYLEKMSKKSLLKELQGSLNLSDMERLQYVNRLIEKGLGIEEIAGSLLHTPTTKANFKADSMQNWPCCRAWKIVFGSGPILPEQFEFLMGYPIGWTDLNH